MKYLFKKKKMSNGRQAEKIMKEMKVPAARTRFVCSFHANRQLEWLCASAEKGGCGVAKWGVMSTHSGKTTEHNAP